MKLADEYVKSQYVFGKGPCLVPKPGKYLPSSHENDFCSCEVHDAYIEGYYAALEDSAKVAETSPIEIKEGSGSCEPLKITEVRVGSVEIRPLLAGMIRDLADSPNGDVK